MPLKEKSDVTHSSPRKARPDAAAGPQEQAAATVRGLQGARGRLRPQPFLGSAQKRAGREGKQPGIGWEERRCWALGRKGCPLLPGAQA